MQYSETAKAIFHQKLNRFIAEVYINGVLEKVHIKNTGRLKELLLPGAEVVLEFSSNPKRKTRWSLIAAKKKDRWVNIDSLAPNRIVWDALEAGKINEFQHLSSMKREVKFGDSRFDLFYNTAEQQGFIEVKGVTLEHDGAAMFPDAPTTRGTKHIKELIKVKRAGYEAAVLFVIQMEDCRIFMPHKEMDPDFTEALIEAESEGVQILAYDCTVSEDRIELNKQIPVELKGETVSY